MPRVTSYLERLDVRLGATRLAAPWQLARTVMAEQGEQRLSLSAAGAAFFLVIAVFPAATAIVAIFGLLYSPNQIAAVLTRWFGDGQGSLGTFFADQMRTILEVTPSRLTLQLVISVLLALWTVGTATYNLSRALRIAYGLPRVPYIRARVRGYLAALALIIVLGLIIVLLTTMNALISGLIGPVSSVVWLIGLPVVWLMDTAVLVGLHAFAVGRRLSLRALVPGCALASAILLVINAGLRSYLVLFPPNTVLYGALAGVVVFMLLTWVGVFVVLLAATFNHALMQRRTLGSRPRSPMAETPGLNPAQ